MTIKSDKRRHSLASSQSYAVLRIRIGALNFDIGFEIFVTSQERWTGLHLLPARTDRAGKSPPSLRWACELQIALMPEFAVNYDGSIGGGTRMVSYPLRSVYPDGRPTRHQP